MTENYSRRTFLQTTGLGAAAMATLGAGILPDKSLGAAPKNPVPRWRGFHYHYFDTRPQSATASGTQANPPPLHPMTAAALEEDFRMISDLGFDFVRIGVHFRDWLNYTDATPDGNPLPKDFFNIKESGLTRIDAVFEKAFKYNLHAQLDMHVVPGYNFRDATRKQFHEPVCLWTDKVAQDAFVHYWDIFARRYRSIGSRQLSFDLMNEPVGVSPRWHVDAEWCLTRDRYRNVMTMAIEKIRETSPERLIFAEGLDKRSTADDIVPELIPLRVAQSFHGYYPSEFSHYRTYADVNKDFLSDPPSWPAKLKDGSTFGPDGLAALYAPWGSLIPQGIGVHVGECGVSAHLPYGVALEFLTDQMNIWKSYGIGWTWLSLYDGDFMGLLDGKRMDGAVYKDYSGHRLDVKLLKLLQDH